MANQKVVRYIKAEQKKGFSDRDIRQALVKAKYKPEVVEEAFSSLRPETKSSQKIRNYLALAVLIVLALAIICVGYSYYQSYQTTQQINKLRSIDTALVKLVHSTDADNAYLQAGVSTEMGNILYCGNLSLRDEKICKSVIYENSKITENLDPNIDIYVKYETVVLGFDNPASAKGAYQRLLAMQKATAPVTEQFGNIIVNDFVLRFQDKVGVMQERHTMYFLSDKLILKVNMLKSSEEAKQLESEIIKILEE